MGRCRRQRDDQRWPVRIEYHTSEDTRVSAGVQTEARRVHHAQKTCSSQQGIRDEAALRLAVPQRQPVRDQLHQHLRPGTQEGPAVASSGDGLPAPQVGKDQEVLPAEDPSLRHDRHLHDHLRPHSSRL